MSTSREAFVDGRFVDGPFLKRFVIVCGLVPAALLAWDGYRHQLGVNDVNFAIRTTGLLGLGFLMLSLLVTPLRRLTGWNVLIAPRRNLGVFGFAYILAHVALFVVLDRDLSLASTATEIVERVYLWFGAGALVLMIPLTLTSTDGMVARLGARRWKQLHRLAYLVALGGVVHFYLLVKADTSRPQAFAIGLGVLLAYRVVQAVVDRQHQARAIAARAATRRNVWSGALVVVAIVQETPDVRTFRLGLPGGGPLPFTHSPGQYLNLALTIGGKRVRRSYTIASAPDRDTCEISVKRAATGVASQHLHGTLVVGSTLEISAPAGAFVLPEKLPARVVLVAGGIGITPMMTIVRSLAARAWTGDVYLLFAVRTRADVVFERELGELQARMATLHVRIALSGAAPAGWTGARGRITREMIEAFVPALRRGPVLLCGPDAMMTATRAMLVAMGLPDGEVLQEAFGSPPDHVDDPSAGDVDAAITAASNVPRAVQFARAGRRLDVAGRLTVLQAAEDAGVAIPSECRAGICGQCKTRLLAGRVVMESQDALSAAERASGVILACQAHAVGDIVVDA